MISVHGFVSFIPSSISWGKHLLGCWHEITPPQKEGRGTIMLIFRKSPVGLSMEACSKSLAPFLTGLVERGAVRMLLWLEMGIRTFFSTHGTANE